MDWFRQVPIGQYVAGNAGWLRLLDPRLKFAWVLMFLLSPVLAGVTWRICLVVSLLGITFVSALPIRIWWRSILILIALAGGFGFLALFLPMGPLPGTLSVRSPEELPGLEFLGSTWELIRLGPIQIGPISLGPIVVDKGSAELALTTSTLIFTVIHSVNLMLLTTPPEDLVWAISWFIAPLACVGLPVERLSFQLLLALRFLPLVQEEFQNLLRSLAIRAVNLKELGLKASFGLVLSVGERLLANILLRAEQGADALLVKGGLLRPADQLRTKSFINRRARPLNVISGILLVLVLSLRRKYGDL